MPYIEAQLAGVLESHQVDACVKELTEIVAAKMGKSESAVMVRIVPQQMMYLGGEALEKGAYIHVKAFGTTSSSAKEAITYSIVTFCKESLGIEQDAVYVTFADHHEWGFKGQFIS